MYAGIVSLAEAGFNLKRKEKYILVYVFSKFYGLDLVEGVLLKNRIN